jgi:hypothetical protein
MKGLWLLLAATSCLQASTYLFVLNRFGGIELTTGPPAYVRFFQGNKSSTVTTYYASLQGASRDFVTPSGVQFRLEYLGYRVVHDPNRKINSGDCRLEIRGDGAAYLRLALKLPPLADFAASEQPMTFYGQRVR